VALVAAANPEISPVNDAIGVVRLVPSLAMMRTARRATRLLVVSTSFRPVHRLVRGWRWSRGGGVRSSFTNSQTVKPDMKRSTPVTQKAARYPNASATTPPMSGPTELPIQTAVWSRPIA
jgi:hypothetical protein